MGKLILSILSVTILTISCQGSCEDAVAYYSPKTCSMIVKAINIGRPFRLEGQNIYTGREDKFSDQGGWYVKFDKYIEVGDTVIKQPNELIFYVHKKDTTLAFPLECQGKIYK